jgi:hypothetical protein
VAREETVDTNVSTFGVSAGLTAGIVAAGTAIFILMSSS